MVLRVIIALILTNSFLGTYSQLNIDSIYVGTITGKPRLEFQGGKFMVDKLIGITDILDSKYKIELRLYETYFLAGLTYCTTIYLDTTFKVNRIKYWRYYDSSKYQPRETNPLETINADRAFSTLISNAVFSLPDKDWDAIFKDSRPKELYPKGLEDAGLLVIADGVGYTLEYKMDNLFNRIYFSNPEAYQKSYPDNQIFRRQAEITKELGAGFE